MNHLRKFAIVFTSCGFSIPLALGATCYTDKPFVLSEPAEAIAALLRLRAENLCNSGNPSFPPRINDNRWNLNELIFRIRRPDTTADLSVCTDAFVDIINQCITHQLWGGQYDWAGSIYTIENDVYGTDVPPVRLVDFVTWAMQETAEYKQNGTDEKRKDASDAAKFAAAFATAGMAPAAVIAALEAAANAQSAVEMEQNLKEADEASDGTLTSSVSSTPTGTTSSTQPSATYNFVRACSGSEFQWPDPAKDPQFAIKNEKGTNFWVEDGCAIVNGSPRCKDRTGFEPGYHVNDQGTGWSKVTIYSKLDTANGKDEQVVPGCKLDLVWPREHLDVWFKNYCLTDASGNAIYNQCCNDNTKTTDKIANPYFIPPDQPQNPTIDPHVGTVECFPTHGSTDNDKVVARAISDRVLDDVCKGTEPKWSRTGGPGRIVDPVNSNHYDATFTLALNAPELCKQVYTEEGKGNVDVQNFCKSPLMAIRNECVFNGGKVLSDCGEWTLQSCPLGGICKVGEPGTHCKTRSQC